MMTLQNVAAVLNIPCPKDCSFTGVCIDSRQIKPGNLFVAVRGERFDGQQFIPEVQQKGAAAILCSTLPETTLPYLIVPDTLTALTQLATHHRKTLACSVIALTGSNGKTTVKEMVAAILPPPAHATPGNLNNHLGVPLSVLQLQPMHRYAVFELGANHAGEIAHSVPIVQPRVTLINNIAPAHIAGFGSIEGVACAKGEIYQGLDAEGTAVINEDDQYAHFWDELIGGKRILRFSRTHSADICASKITLDSEGRARFELTIPNDSTVIQLQVVGEHNVSNALAAAACCYAAGISLEEIAKGLNQFQGVNGRLTFCAGKKDSVIINDTYNANLRSTLTAVTVLAKRQGKRIFVLGDMGELGVWSIPHHQEVGTTAREQGIDLLLTYGKDSEHAAHAFGTAAHHYSTQEALIEDLLGKLDKDTTVLVKGSRSARMEKIVQHLLE